MSDTTPQDRITEFWSMVAPDYEAHAGNVAEVGTDEYARWVDYVREALPPAPSDVLDVATGTGFLALIAASLGHRVTGIDLSEEMLTEARRGAESRALAADFQKGDAVEPDFPPACFDVVTNRHLLWTLREPETAMRNWRQLLRGGGRVVSIDGFWFGPPPEEEPEEPGIFEQRYTRETRSALPLMHVESVDPAIEMFERAGFAPVTAAHLTDLLNDEMGAAPYLIVAHR